MAESRGNGARRPGQRIWQVAVYIRLSREDGNDESLSVTNQKKIIAGYMETGFEGAFTLVGHYIDDGETGTDHDRPAFRQMIRDMEAGRIDCIVCKNLSRMFRNYADQGYFLEKVFPEHRVRFVTVSEPKIDSYLHPETLFGLEVPINGLMNDRFAAKTSRDIRETFAAKRRKGEFIGAFPPYGYKRFPGDKNKLCIDQEAAEVVRDIYCWYVYEGMSKGGIARELNERGILSPSAYKRSKGLRFSCPQMEKSKGLWSPRAVTWILKNQVYTGAMVQGRQTVISYKVHEKVAVPEEDWTIVLDRHEPIIPEALFQRAGQIQKAAARTPPGKSRRHLLSGLIYCADCGRAMTRQETRGIVYYYCRTYREQSREACTKHTVREDAVLKALSAAVREHLDQPEPPSVGSAQETGRGQQSGTEEPERGRWSKIEEPEQERRSGAALAELCRGALDRREREVSRLAELSSQRQRELEKVTKIIDGLYGDWKEGLIDKEGYIRLKERYSARAEQLEHAIRTIQAQYGEIVGDRDGKREDGKGCLMAGGKIKAGGKAKAGGKTKAGDEIKAGDKDHGAGTQSSIQETLDRGLLTALVQGIYVHEGGGLKIVFTAAGPGREGIGQRQDL